MVYNSDEESYYERVGAENYRPNIKSEPMRRRCTTKDVIVGLVRPYNGKKRTDRHHRLRKVTTPTSIIENILKMPSFFGTLFTLYILFAVIFLYTLKYHYMIAYLDLKGATFTHPNIYNTSQKDAFDAILCHHAYQSKNKASSVFFVNDEQYTAETMTFVNDISMTWMMYNDRLHIAIVGANVDGSRVATLKRCFEIAMVRSPNTDDIFHQVQNVIDTYVPDDDERCITIVSHSLCASIVDRTILDRIDKDIKIFFIAFGMPKL